MKKIIQKHTHNYRHENIAGETTKKPADTKPHVAQGSEL